MVIIFWFSHQSGGESSGLSSQIVSWIVNNLHISVSEFIVRKCAHISEYALLTLTFIYGFYKNELKWNRVLFFSFLTTFLYACFDECHQLFINGRAGQFTDVLIDSIGILLAILFIYFIHLILKKED